MILYTKKNDAADGTRTHMVSRTILSRMRLPIPPQRQVLTVIKTA